MLPLPVKIWMNRTPRSTAAGNEAVGAEFADIFSLIPYILAWRPTRAIDQRLRAPRSACGTPAHTTRLRDDRSSTSRVGEHVLLIEPLGHVEDAPLLGQILAAGRIEIEHRRAVLRRIVG